MNIRPDYVPDYRHCLLPYVQWFQDDFLGGIRGMKAQEIGIYTVLLNEMYNRGVALDQTDERLARMCGTDVRTFRKVVEMLIEDEKLVRLNCGLWNIRCENAFTSRAEMLKKQSAAGKTSAIKRRKNKGRIERPLDERSTDAEPISEAQNLSIEEPKGSLSETTSDEQPRKALQRKYPKDFEAFWSDYPRSPNMSKSKALAGWRKLTEAERAACHRAVPAYRAFLASKADHPTMHATTFINERRFEGFAPEPPKPVDETVWQKRLTYGRSRRGWFTGQWGPAPGQVGCSVPEHLLKPDDGAGWREMEKAA
ncbi:DUF1376 domain-containing protein [Sinorhizobium meliloti]|uniref:DUF1376 domain-containing protein n=1 Tax=Rhizobium meliloti TaxID=382 RepID=UPI000FDA00B0|nr:DUF1376 domain-containing protein [Sinorhizobium meliloti]RVM15105.1 DUF1376 domain-containing protein [Sinorhizobium meliloti]RVO28319.1 DUF1376 domain-containing protein [Sinorhizobium meliloti]